MEEFEVPWLDVYTRFFECFAASGIGRRFARINLSSGRFVVPIVIAGLIAALKVNFTVLVQ
jgi:hypothetical protein